MKDLLSLLRNKRAAVSGAEEKSTPACSPVPPSVLNYPSTKVLISWPLAQLSPSQIIGPVLTFPPALGEIPPTLSHHCARGPLTRRIYKTINIKQISCWGGLKKNLKLILIM
jgi:hypothetical protein